MSIKNYYFNYIHALLHIERNSIKLFVMSAIIWISFLGSVGSRIA